MIRRLLLTGALFVGALSGMAQGGTLAYLTGSASGTANQFSAGTVDISSSPASAFIGLSGMLPGDKVTAPITVVNNGTLPQRYAVSSAVTDADAKGLGGQIVLTIKSKGTGNGVVADCTTALFGDASKWQETDYGPDSALGTLPAGASRDLIGTAAANPNGGRTLASGASEVLCFQVTVPASTGSAFQNATTTAMFSFAAQQL